MIKRYDIFYRKSQGQSRDREIIERYRIIISYFIDNPDRINANGLALSILYHNDAVLMKHEPLRNELLERVLNCELKNQISEN